MVKTSTIVIGTVAVGGAIAAGLFVRGVGGIFSTVGSVLSVPKKIVDGILAVPEKVKEAIEEERQQGREFSERSGQPLPENKTGRAVEEFFRGFGRTKSIIAIEKGEKPSPFPRFPGQIDPAERERQRITEGTKSIQPTDPFIKKFFGSIAPFNKGM